MPLKDSDMFHAMEHGDFPVPLLASARRVVIVLTQDWCPQWHDMVQYLPDFADQAAIYTLAYNRHPRFQEIMEFKEDVWGNREVPYIRAYLDGRLLHEGNWLPRNTFAALLKREHRSG